MGQGVGLVSEDTQFPGMGWVWLGMDMAEALRLSIWGKKPVGLST